ncbi:hypothetical protein AMATHDRAFT_9859 [Amanita thiersii Skay4041]|uniref:Uncharacterized protein n=1 Tax=Amanita thiersii Skay4041 TaxID=703135 RepID=A0A2A9N863_9AGAR|nr:hypothetical protein AMATHDRAFT_9859 [Amanita thiersii Skay4041]
MSFMDRFKLLCIKVEASQEEAYFLLKRGLNDSVIQAAFGGFNVIPTTYMLLVKELKTLATNYEEVTLLAIRLLDQEPYGVVVDVLWK